MRPDLVVVRGIRLKDTTQVRLAEDDHLIEAFASSRTDQPFDVSILPGRTRRDWMIADAHRTNAPSVGRPERAIAVAEQMTRRFAPGEGFGHLTRDPLCRWI